MRGCSIGLLVCITALASISAAPAAIAATYCVTNVSELQAALSAAADSLANDEIRIQQGTYAVNQQLIYISPNPGWVSLTGGWIPSGATHCSQQLGVAANTILTGSNLHPVLAMYFSPTGPVSSGPRYSLQNLSIRDGYGDSAILQRGGLQMSSTADVQVEFWIDNLIVAKNSGAYGGGADLYVLRGLIRVVNSLFVDNRAPTSAFGHLSAIAVTGDGPIGVIIANSTFANGQCAGLGGRGCGIGAILGDGMTMDIVNTIFFNNSVSDVNIEGAASAGYGDGTAYADYSRIGALSGTIGLTATHPQVGDPRFVDAANRDFQLRDDSPFINRGLGPIPIYSYSDFDLNGSPRSSFDNLDPGAYENQTWDFIFANGFQ